MCLKLQIEDVVQAGPCYLSLEPRLSVGWVGRQLLTLRMEAKARNEKKTKRQRLVFLYSGGVGGNRTRVQKHSTDSSTYLVLPFDLTTLTRTHTLQCSELP